MTTLLFAIPTWNRAAHLERCVESIANQVSIGQGVHILIGDDCSTDDTPRVITSLQSKYPFITTYRKADRTDYAAAFQALFTHDLVADAEWVWTFGDDDTLEPGALSHILKEIAKADDVCFFHVAEATRSSSTPSAHTGTLFDLCCNFGWIEMTGFITGNITRGSYLHAAGSTHRWNWYARSAFVQSCALLEVLHDKPAVFLDLPLVRSQENHQSPETLKRWGDDNIAVRYTYLSDCIQLMYVDKVLKARVPKKFFRYLVYHLWDRFITFQVQDYVQEKKLWPLEVWARVKLFSEFLADEKERQEVAYNTEMCQALLAAHAFGSQALGTLSEQAFALAQTLNVEMYPYGYREAGTGHAAVHGEPPTSSPLPSSSPPS